MIDDDDLTDFILRQLWTQVRTLAERLPEPQFVYSQIVDDLVACLGAQQLPGKDVAAILVELMRKYRDLLLAAI